MAQTPEPLPELTLALRTLGSRRGRRGDGNEHERFFAPLLEARRGAARAGDLEAAVMAFDAARLTASLDKTLRALAADRAPAGRAPARRALEARLQERVEPLREAVGDLGELADALLAADEDARPEAWRRWADQLRRVFACADRCWPGVDAALEASGAPRRRGWLARVFRRGRS
ncbi:MAG: hypothetical protein ABR499_17800 [Gemmatimonadaceae bacterium]